MMPSVNKARVRKKKPVTVWAHPNSLGQDFLAIEREARVELFAALKENKVMYRKGRPPKKTQRPPEDFELEGDGIEGIDFVSSE